MPYFFAIMLVVGLIYLLVKGYFIHARYVDNLISQMREEDEL